MRVLCYGDSNTYGYDPRSQLGGRYPIQVRWTGRLTEQGYQVENWGLNGREIPTRPREWEAVESLIARESSGDRVVVMLGTNDLLQPGLTARDVAARMEDFLARPGMRRLPVLLVAPPPMVRGVWVTEDRHLTQSALLGEEYRHLARRLGVDFADAGAWDIPLLFDGVHFTPEGHRRFAQELARCLEAL